MGSLLALWLMAMPLVTILFQEAAFASDKNANCVLKSNDADILKIQNIRVTSANGGLRQNCTYQVLDNKISMRTAVFDLMGGILVGIYYNSRGDGNLGEQVVFEHTLGNRFSTVDGKRVWELKKKFQSPLNPEETMEINCTMSFPANIPIPRNDGLVGLCPTAAKDK